tara:strand:+ start:2997 stop:4010 length:1014 start_codon:yes stop_codon:yes gene_type:complete
MSDKSKFEQMLEKLVADDRTAAEEIFHDIVVEKSRSIYEGLLEDDIKDIEVEETSKEDSKEEETTEASKEDKKEDEKVEEKTSEESKEDEAVEEASKDESKEEETKEEESKDEEATDESLLDVEQTAVAPVEAGGDATDDMVGDIEAPAGDMDNGDDSEKGEEEIEDRVVDLEDAIDDLKAEFEKMMHDKEDGDDAEDHGDDAEDNGDKEEEAVVDQSAEGETVEVAPELGEQPAVETAEPKTASEEIREYVNKVGVTHTDGSDSTKSPVAGKNDMGGTSSNIAKGGEEKGSSTPASKEDNAGNINVPGAKVKQSAAPKAQTKADDDGSAKKSTMGS